MTVDADTTPAPLPCKLYPECTLVGCKWPDCECSTCGHPTALHGDQDGCVRFVHAPDSVLVRCGCKETT